MRAVKHSPRLFSDGILKDYLLYRFRKPLTIVVLGMHRSGTSFVTRAINLLGAHIGDDLIGKSNSNPAGHWEHTYSLEINRRLLEMAEAQWDDPPNNVKAGFISKFRIKLFLINLHKGGTTTAVWKDPRTLLTFSVWIEEIANYIPVFVFRHPSSVCSSLQRRNGFTKDKSLNLWLEYNSKLLQIESQEEDSHIINFDGGSEHIYRSLRTISGYDGLKFNKEAIEFYDESIRTSDSCNSELGGKVNEIYQELKSRTE